MDYVQTATQDTKKALKYQSKARRVSGREKSISNAFRFVFFLSSRYMFLSCCYCCELSPNLWNYNNHPNIPLFPHVLLYTELNLNFLNCCMSLIFECFLVPSIVVLVPRYTCQRITALPNTIYYTIRHSVMANQIILMTTCRLVMMLYSTSSSFDTDNNPNRNYSETTTLLK